jgi:hypothetical protein
MDWEGILQCLKGITTVLKPPESPAHWEIRSRSGSWTFDERGGKLHAWWCERVLTISANWDMPLASHQQKVRTLAWQCGWIVSGCNHLASIVIRHKIQNRTQLNRIVSRILWGSSVRIARYQSDLISWEMSNSCSSCIPICNLQQHITWRRSQVVISVQPPGNLTYSHESQ